MSDNGTAWPGRVTEGRDRATFIEEIGKSFEQSLPPDKLGRLVADLVDHLLAEYSAHNETHKELGRVGWHLVAIASALNRWKSGEVDTTYLVTRIELALKRAAPEEKE